MEQFDIKLKNGKKVFSTLSSAPEEHVFESERWDRIIFLLHGFPDVNTSFNDLWDVIIKSFANEKVLILAPLMRGYEESSQGYDDDYKASCLADDVRSWIETLVASKDTPVHLVGHDWGAIAVYKMASLWPNLVTSIVCLNIPYLCKTRIWELVLYCPQQIYLSSYFLTMQSRLVYAWKLSQTSNYSYIDKLWKYWSPNWIYSANEISDVKKRFAVPGVIEAATAYYRCLLRPLNWRDATWPIDFEKVPTLILGGESDKCLHRTLFELDMNKLQNCGNVQVKIFSRVGHFMHREDPKKIGEEVSSWFLQNC